MISTTISEVGTIIDEMRNAMETSNSEKSERPETAEDSAQAEASAQDERKSAGDTCQDEARASNSGKPSEAPEPPTTLTFGGTTVHSLDELRQSCTKEALLGYFHEGRLEEWLQKHYYEKQADDVGMIGQDDRKAFSKLCKALGIDSLDGSVEAKKEARNQEELATLLRDEEDEIYLYGIKCKTMRFPYSGPAVSTCPEWRFHRTVLHNVSHRSWKYACHLGSPLCHLYLTE